MKTLRYSKNFIKTLILSLASIVIFFVFIETALRTFKYQPHIKFKDIQLPYWVSGMDIPEITTTFSYTSIRLRTSFIFCPGEQTHFSRSSVNWGLIPEHRFPSKPRDWLLTHCTSCSQVASVIHERSKQSWISFFEKI